MFLCCVRGGGGLTSTERSHGGQRDTLGTSIPRMMVVVGKSPRHITSVTRLTSGGKNSPGAKRLRVSLQHR